MCIFSNNDTDIDTNKSESCDFSFMLWHFVPFCFDYFCFVFFSAPYSLLSPIENLCLII